jgi:DNA polymerase V
MPITAAAHRPTCYTPGAAASRIAMVDCNNFYASCERLLDPSLQNVPVAVLSSNDGCIIARSEEVKKLGVPMGAPLFQWKDTLQKHGVRFFSANFSFYADVSARIIKLLTREVPAIEVYSIDEAFLDFTGMDRFFDLEAFAQRLRHLIKDEVGIPVSIGIGPTKVLAKVANRIAKEKKTTFVESLLDAAQQEAVLRAMPVYKVWGVGPRNAERFMAAGINTAWDLRTAPEGFVRSLRSVTEMRIVHELQGRPCLQLEEDVVAKKHIASTRSFGTPVTKLQDLREAVSFYTATAALKLRQQESAAGYVSVFIHTNPHNKREGYYDRHAVRVLPLPSAYTPELTRYALDALDEIFAGGLRYKKAGVMLGGIVPLPHVQASLFDAPGPAQVPPDKQLRASRAIDGLVSRYGREKLGWAIHYGKDKSWQAKAEFKSSPIDMGVTDADRARTKPWW